VIKTNWERKDQGPQAGGSGKGETPEDIGGIEQRNGSLRHGREIRKGNGKLTGGDGCQWGTQVVVDVEVTQR